MDSKFKVGDKVIIRNDENDEASQSKLSDLESDMRLDLADRSLSGTAYDAFWKAISEGQQFVVPAVTENGDYELKLGKRPFCYTLEEEDLEAAT